MQTKVVKGLVADTETFYDQKTYSLRKMRMQAYLSDRRMEVIGWAVKPILLEMRKLPGLPKYTPTRVLEAGETKWAEGNSLHEWLSDPETASAYEVVVCHNAQFDAGVLSRLCPSYRPSLIIDTMHMGRAYYGPALSSFSLGKLGKALGLGGKKDDGSALVDASGLRLKDMQAMPSLYEQYRDYAIRDVDLTFDIFSVLLPATPAQEFVVSHWATSMFAYPQLLLNLDTARLVLKLDEAIREKAIEEAGVDPGQLTSDVMLRGLLESRGVAIPYKTSSDTGKRIPALSKDDLEFRKLIMDLEASDNEYDRQTAVICNAAITLRSSIYKTRPARLIEATEGEPYDGSRAWLRAPIAYAGALQTKRFSGEDKLNLQNLPRAPITAVLDGKEVTIGLRDCIEAPDGYVLVVIDSSNVELRVVSALAGQLDVIGRLVSGKDEYATMASRVYGREINKKDDPEERQVGKVAVLSLGYQASWRTFQAMLMSQTGKLFDEEMCRKIVDTYRSTYTKIKQLWWDMDDFLRSVAGGHDSPPPKVLESAPLMWMNKPPYDIGFMSTPGRSGARLTWPEMHLSVNEKTGRQEVRYRNARYQKGDGTGGWTTLYGGKAVENMSQFLAREVVNYQTFVLMDKMPNVLVLPPALQVHDEIVMVVREDLAEEVLEEGIQCMSGPLPWWPELVTAAEGGIARVYGEAK